MFGKHKASDNTSGKSKAVKAKKAKLNREEAAAVKKMKSHTKHSWQDGMVDN